MTNPEDQAQQVKDALFAGNKIAAIKLYREQTGAGLAEAKAAVEKLEVELRTSAPSSFQSPASKGCAVSMLAAAFFVAAVWRIFT